MIVNGDNRCSYVGKKPTYDDDQYVAEPVKAGLYHIDITQQNKYGFFSNYTYSRPR